MKKRRGLSGKYFTAFLVIFLLVASGAGAAAASVLDPANLGFATATDNCDPEPVVTYADQTNMGGCGGYTGTVTRTWTATDSCGNAAQCTQMINIVDNTPPIIYCPSDTTIECDDSRDPSQTGYATAKDNCDQEPDISYSDKVDLSGCGGVITRTWTATDACGNSARCVQEIHIIDENPPIIICPPETTIECDESKDPSNTGYATATDTCTPNPSITYIDSVQMLGCGGTITRIWRATDACGNMSECVQIIHLVDTTPPVIICPPDVTIECDELMWNPEPEPEPEPDPPYVANGGC